MVDNTDQPLRVTIDVSPLYGHRTGVGVAAAGMVEALSRRSDVVLDPYLVSFRARPQPGHRRLPVPGLVASHWWSRRDWPRVDRWAGAADVLHGTNYVVPPSRIPSVVSVYDCWFLRHPDLASPVVRRAGARLRRSVAAGAFVHASSQATAAEVRELLVTDRVEVVPLGPPPAPPALHELAAPDSMSDLGGRRMIVAVATEERRKGLPLLVEAFGQLAPENDVMLVLAGAPGDDSDAITNAVSALAPDIAANVRRLGPVDDAVKHWLLRRASVVAYPSLDEGFGFPILEGQLAGAAVVACNVGAVPEIAGEGALLVNDRTPDAFAVAMRRALDDGATRLALIEAGNRNAGHYSWDRTADAIVALYSKAAER